MFRFLFFLKNNFDVVLERFQMRTPFLHHLWRNNAMSDLVLASTVFDSTFQHLSVRFTH
jgi:hypothetical protein